MAVGPRRAAAALALGLMMATMACSDGRPSVTSRPPQGRVEVADTVYRVLARVCDSGDLAVATGVAVSNDLVATVAHTLVSAESIEVEDRSGRRESAEVAWLDPERDVALLRLATPASSWLPVGPAQEGDRASIVTITNPASEDGRSGDATGFDIEEVETEILSEVDITVDGEGERAGFELEGEIELGDSGSPVVNVQDELVAIIFGSNRKRSSGWAVAAKEIEAALAQQEGGLVTLNC